MASNGYRDLRIWQGGVALAESVYRATSHFPRSEQASLGLQMRRAAVSVPSNIAEGWGRSSKLDYLRFLAIARGSLFETATHVEIAHRVGLIADPEASELRACGDLLGRQLLTYMRVLRR